MRFFNKKGQGLSLQVIIIALLCLIVLVILLAIVSGKLKIFGKGVSHCEGKGGSCVSTCDESTDRMRIITGTDCETPERANQVCCFEIY